MLKIIIPILALIVIYKLFANDFLKKRQEQQDATEKVDEQKVASGELVKDPICGTYVSATEAISVRDGERTYRFCSYDCRDTFLKQIKDGSRTLPSAEAVTKPEKQEEPAESTGGKQ